MDFAISSSWSEPVFSILFLLTVWSFSIFVCKEYNQSDFSIDHLAMSMCRVIFWVVGKGCLLWPACSPDKTVSLCPASFWGFPGGTSGKETTCQWKRCKRGRFDPWVGKISWRRAWQPTPVFLCGVSLWIGEPGRLWLIEFQAIRHDWSDLAHALLHFVLQGQTCLSLDFLLFHSNPLWWKILFFWC